MMKLNRILSAAVAMAMSFTMFAGAVSLPDDESEEIPAPQEAYEMVHHLTESKTRGTSVPRKTYDLSKGIYSGTFKFDSSLYSNYLLRPDGGQLHISGFSDYDSDYEMPVKVFFIDVFVKNTIGYDIHKELQCNRKGSFDRTIYADDSETYFLMFSKAIDGVTLSGSFIVE